MSSKKKKKKANMVYFLKIEIHNGVADEVRSADEPDDVLSAYIQVYKDILEAEGVEVYETGNTYLICEDFICVAAYKKELK